MSNDQNLVSKMYGSQATSQENDYSIKISSAQNKSEKSDKVNVNNEAN